MVNVGLIWTWSLTKRSHHKLKTIHPSPDTTHHKTGDRAKTTLNTGHIVSDKFVLGHKMEYGQHYLLSVACSWVYVYRRGREGCGWPDMGTIVKKKLIISRESSRNVDKISSYQVKLSRKRTFHHFMSTGAIEKSLHLSYLTTSWVWLHCYFH